jgi:hypothetical protein
MLAIFIPPIATVERKLELVYLITASTHRSIDSLRVPQLHSSLILLRHSKEARGETSRSSSCGCIPEGETL